ncbi:hypothetical protein [Methylobacterium nigriterrae]|uniref:hypothetical protein n=1 Tax=Methylobacterium nigriterrae TaxID=3127512 RepID=UPI0030139DA4
MLEYGVGAGSTAAAYALAQTYDPAALLVWRAVGVQGDTARAKELYRRAAAGGFGQAGERLRRLD